MFNSIVLKPIEFHSNPPLDPAPAVNWKTREDGSPVNFFELVPRDHRSPLDGAHYDPSRDSLTARLNLGIPLQKVSIGITENDPNILQRTAQRVSAQIQSRLSEAADASVPAVSASVIAEV